MNRRDFIKFTSITGAFTVLNVQTSWALTRQEQTTNIQQPLAIPPMIETSDQHVTELNIQSGQSSFLPHLKTETAGINGSFLGPALKMRRGKVSKLKVNNQLDETITLHWHGLDIAGKYDGGPHQKVPSNQSWRVDIPIEQPAATCWFHPHQYPNTADLVMRGIAGLIVIEDEESDALNLPSDWGFNDIPVIIQDRRFDDKGQFDYELLDIVNVAMGFAGDTLLTNGIIHPKVDVPQGWVRLRLLNGSNARSYQLSASDQREFYVIASDSGFIEKPIRLTQLHMVAGERYEIMIKISGKEPFDLITSPIQQMGMRAAPFNRPVPFLSLVPQATVSHAELPEQLTKIKRYQLADAKVKREIVLGMGEHLDQQAMMLMMQKQSRFQQRMQMANDNKMNMGDGMPMKSDHMMAGKFKESELLTPDDLKNINSINGKAFDMNRIDLEAKRGILEHWVISQGGDMMVHPFHIHGCRFQILSIDGEAPAAHLAGWKDTVTVFPKGKSEVLLKFNHLADDKTPYMAHCHILEHEDTGMMMQFTVS